MAVFLLQLAIGEPFTRGFSLVPREITTGRDLTKPTAMQIKVSMPDRYGRTTTRKVEVQVPQARGPRPVHLTLLTSMFMHGGWVHLIGNMWFLLIFGRNIERAMGGQLFLVFYLTCGIVSGFADVLVASDSVIPYLGASGAISGVMGAYFFIFPLNKVKVWFGFYVGVVELPSVAVVGFWFLIQYFSTVMAVTSGEVHTGVAYWSHLGGFLTGIVFILITLAILKYQHAKEEEAEPEVDEKVLNAKVHAAINCESEVDALFSRAAETRNEMTADYDPFKNFLPAPTAQKDDRISAAM